MSSDPNKSNKDNKDDFKFDDNPSSENAESKPTFEYESKTRKIEEEELKRKQLKEQKAKVTKEKVTSTIRKVLHDQFHGILDENKVFYTVIFFIGAIVVALMAIGGITANLGPLEVAALLFTFGFLILMVLAMIPPTRKLMFEEQEWKKKAIFCLIAFGIGLVITIIYLGAGSQTGVLNFLKPDVLLPAIFVVVFIGWNLIQIHFIKDGLENVAVSVEKKVLSKGKEDERRQAMSRVFLIVSVLVPFFLVLVTFIGFFGDFAGDDATYLWAWLIVMIGIIAFTFYGQIRLYQKSQTFERPNIFSHMFFILMWVYFWFRSFGFISALRSEIVSGLDQGWFSQLLLVTGDIFLLAFTSIMVLKGLAARVKKSGSLNEDAVPFFVYAFTVMYVAGQVVMILNVDTFGSRNVVNMFINILILITSLVYYMYYSKYVLQKMGYIPRTILTLDEAKMMMLEYADALKKDIHGQESYIDAILIKTLNKYKIPYVPPIEIVKTTGSLDFVPPKEKVEKIIPKSKVPEKSDESEKSDIADELFK
jgi:hypothetical protein